MAARSELSPLTGEPPTDSQSSFEAQIRQWASECFRSPRATVQCRGVISWLRKLREGAGTRLGPIHPGNSLSPGPDWLGRGNEVGRAGPPS